MRPTRVRVSRTAVLVLLCLALAGATAEPAAAVAPPVRTLVPIGSDDQADTLRLFARESARHDTGGHVVILVLPITYSLSADSTKNGERSQKLKLADHRRAMIEDACNGVKAPDQVCDAQLLPTLVRADAHVQSNLDFFTPDMDGLDVPGGDRTVAISPVAGTPLEAKMAEAYAGGGMFGGNISADVEASAPADMLSGGVAFKARLTRIGGLNVQPRLLPDRSWGQLFRLDGRQPGTLAAGINVGTAVEAGVTARRSAATVRRWCSTVCTRPSAMARTRRWPRPGSRSTASSPASRSLRCARRG